MGQKVNPIIFRQALSKPQVSAWFSKNSTYSHLISQELEIKKFLSFLLRSQGIVLRSSRIVRTDHSLIVDLDLYFSYILAKQSKFSWAKSFFKTIKKKYTTLARIKDFKNFLDNLQKKEDGFKADEKDLTLPQRANKNFFTKSSTHLRKDCGLDYKDRFFFFLILKEKKKFLLKKKKKMSVLSIIKRSIVPKFIRIKLPKLAQLFRLRKFHICFRDFWYKNTTFTKKNNNTTNLLALNKSLCKSLQHFTGLEKIKIRVHSNQLRFLPSFKLYYSFFTRELVMFQKNRSLQKYFFEILEVLYFVAGTFSFGNAFLLSKLISFLLENSRKHVFIVKFIRKVLNILFNKLPSKYLAINGIKILIKGRFNKRRRTKTLVLQEGQISLQTLDTSIDYNQTQAITLYGSFGIKVWLSKK